MELTRDALEISETLKGKYEAVIGLEVHVQLRTRSKIFCGCSTRFGDPPNTNSCPVCLGLPGALPVLNREAVAMAVKASLALNCRVNPFSRFARKNYFYPDLPKGYQISQFDQPLAEHGWIEIRSGDGQTEGEKTKRIGITRLHMEEDAGKSIHDGFPDSQDKSYVDLNRSGTPLAEIVSEPDLRSSAEAYDYVTRLKQILEYLDVSDCNMEEGSLRCDANVSVRPRGQQELGVKAEVKNLNSFRYLQKALDYEIARQTQLLERGEKVTQETRLWNLQQQKTVSMRSKESSHDYRYFPEPDLLPLVVSDAWREEIQRTLPELPDAKRRRFASQYGLSEYDAEVLTASQALAGYYEKVTAAGADPKLAANWVMGDLLGVLKKNGIEISDSPLKPDALAGLLKLIMSDQESERHERRLAEINKELGITDPKQLQPGEPVQEIKPELWKERKQIQEKLGKTLSGKMAKIFFKEMFAKGSSVEQVVQRLGLSQIVDPNKIRNVIHQVIAANPKQLAQYKSGKTSLIGYFVGQVMKETKGQANPQKVNELLKEELGGA